MKHLVVVLYLVLFVSVSCYSNYKFSIVGQIYNKSIRGEAKLILGKGSSDFLVSDIKNGRFEFSGSIVDKYEYVYFVVTLKDGESGSWEFFIKSDTMAIEILNLNDRSLNGLRLKNLPFIEETSVYYNLIHPISDSITETYEQKNLIKYFRNSKSSIDSIDSRIKELKQTLLSRKINFLLRYKDQYIGLYVFSNNVLTSIEAYRVSADSLMSLFDNFTPFLKNSNLGRQSYNLLVKKKSLSLKSYAPNFAFLTNTGESFNLMSFRGKRYVLLCFWDSWCGPCIKTIPLLKRIANQYSNDELQMISISLDDNDSIWKNSILKYDMPWIQSCDVPPYIKSNRIRDLYDIEYIPQYFLIDKLGNIIYHNTQSDDDDGYTLLQNKLKELFKH